MKQLNVTDKHSGHQIEDGDLMGAYIALCCMGKPDLEAVHEMDGDPEFYGLCLGEEQLSSEAALRQRWIRQTKADARHSSKRTRKRSGTIASRRRPCPTAIFRLT